MKCPCHSQLYYSNCCKPYHTREKKPNPLALMRSRYAAYALSYPSYIIETTHIKSPLYNPNLFTWAEELRHFCMTHQFTSLKISSHYIGKFTSYVNFQAGLEKQGKNASFSENSQFQLEGDDWFYFSSQ